MAQVPLAAVQATPIPLLTGGTITTDDGNVQGSFAINLKYRQISTDNKPGTPTDHGGLTTWAASSATGESDRGSIVWNNVMYRVQGASVYAYGTDGTRTKIGTVANDGLRCRLDYSFDFLLIVSAGKLYYYAPGGFSNVTAASVVNGGLTYAVGDTITIGPLGIYATLTVASVTSGTQASAVATIDGTSGALTAITVTAGGTGYSAPTVTIDAPPTGGTQATAHAVVTNGVITSFVIDAAGAGYTSTPNVTIEAPDGGGIITAVNVTTSPQTLTAYLPTNPAPQVLSSGGGTGATFNLTWASIGDFIEVDMARSAGITPVVDACYIAGYVMVTDGTDVWCSSLVNLTFFPGYYGSAEYDPDGITYIFKLNNQLYVGGQRTHQVMQNTGGNNFPFTVSQSYTFDIGCVSRQTMCYYNRTLAWIGGGRNMPNGVWLLNGNEPNKISSAAVDYEIAQLTAEQVSVVTLETISYEDSELLYVHLPDKTLVFDATATVATGIKFWTQLNSGPTDTSFYRARNFCQFDGKWMCGDLSDNRVGYLDPTTGGHYLEPVLHRTIGPMVMLPLQSAGLRSVELKCITGQTGDTSRISFQYSSDGIRWSMPRLASAAPRGAYDRRIRWLPAGLARDRMQVKIEHITTQHVTWFGVMVELEPLAT